MQEIIFTIGLIAYGIFAIQFLVSLFGYDADIDIDFDFDGDVDFSLSDFVSFKGIIHFLMGSTSYLYSIAKTANTIETIDWFIALVVGVIFVIGLYYVYKLCLKLQRIPKREEDLSDREVTILRKVSELTYVGATTINGAYEQIDVESSEPLEIGKAYKISKFKNNKIYI